MVSANDTDRYNRRLSDKITAAFAHACVDGDLIVASELLYTLELVLLREPLFRERRQIVISPLLAFHGKLWALKATARVEEKVIIQSTVFTERAGAMQDNDEAGVATSQAGTT